MANELPEDLETEILLWLPVASLLRFKCVCKLWYAVINHQNFRRKHFLRNNNKNSNTLLLKTTRGCVVSTHSYETFQVSRTQHLPPPYPLRVLGGREAEIYVAGSCNGLVCLHDSYALCVVIWNPATNETKVVPKSYLPRNAPAGYRTTVESMGFGFDAKTNDYKIFNVRSFRHPSIIQSENIFQTEVYSLSADSWRKVDGPPCLRYDRLNLRGNTSMGWLLVSHEVLIGWVFCHLT
ncbi:hypothetical protein SLA2020_441980 [Shorea laevis]